MHDGCDESGTPQLDPRKQKAVDLLREGHTKVDVARQVGISRQALYNWLKYDPEVREALQDEGNGLLACKAIEAVHTYGKLLNSRSAWIRYRAARDILKVSWGLPL